MRTDEIKKISWAEYAKASFPQYADGLMSGMEAVNGVGFHDSEDRNFCRCGGVVRILSMIGSPYNARCETCGAEIQDLTGPILGNGVAWFVDYEKVEVVAEDKTWAIVSKAPSHPQDKGSDL